MDCPRDEELAAWLSGELEVDSAAQLESHLSDCPSCREVALGQAPPQLEAGALVGRYRLERHVGAGSMGIVWAARDEVLGRPVALKLLRPLSLHANDGRAPERLLREAQALARLQHPNVIAVYDAGSIGGRSFLVMELFDGLPLRQWAAGRSWQERLQALVDAGRGLAAAHRAGLLHRDVKPDNVLVANSGRVAIGDFGLARPREEMLEELADAEAEPPAEAATATSSMTAPGTLIGTPAYMAPEVLAGRPADERSDQYSYCVTLYEVLHGARPNQPHRRSQALPRRVERALARGLSVLPEARFPSMDALLATLEGKRSRLNVWLVAALVVLTLGAGWLVRQQRLTARVRRACAASAPSAPVWDDARRGAVAKALGDAGGATEARFATLQTLDNFFAEWAQQRERACHSTIVDSAGERQQLARLTCLDDRLADTRALLEVASEAKSDPARAQQAIDWLPPLDECRNPSSSAPRSPAADELRKRLAHIEAALSVGRLQDAERQARVADSDAQRLAYEPLQATAACTLGDIYVTERRYKEAREALYRCVQHAEKTGNQRYKARAWSSLAEISGYFDQNLDEARAFIGNARVALQMGNIYDIDVDALQVDIEEAHILALAGRETAALRVLDAAIGHCGLGCFAGERLSLLGHKAQLLNRLGRREEALPLAHDATETALTFYGRGQPATASYLSKEGTILTETGHYARAIKLLQEAVAVRTSGDPANLSASWIQLSDAQYWKGLMAEAATSAQHAIEVTERAPEVDRSRLMNFLALAADCYLGLGQPARAKSLIDRALSVSLSGHDSSDEAAIRKVLAKYYVAVHQTRRALVEARHALALREAVGCEGAAQACDEEYFAFGDVALAADEPKLALAAFQQVSNMFMPTDPADIWRAFYGAGKAQARLGRRDRALELVDRAIGVYRRTDGDAKRLDEMLQSRRAWAGDK